ncbi:SMP-30/gluconolactonase/LRE family protein [Tessaracoccus terricola]
MVHVDVLVPRRAECGEGPVWHAPSGSVFWVDIIAGEVLRTGLDGGRPATTGAVSLPWMVGAVSPRTDDGLVAAVESGFVGLDEDGTVTRRVDCLPDGVRMNDAKVDPAGRFWAGSCAYDFAPGRGGLWVLDEHWRARQVLSGLRQPNGLGWSPDGSVFYLVETQDRQVLRFRFDPTTSGLGSDPEVLVGSDVFRGVPDGLAVDTRGHLWVAEFGGSALSEFTADGALVQRINIPTPQPTSCAFVGPGLDQLWVTSAADGLGADAHPEAGSVFLVTGHGATGVPVPAFGGVEEAR